jgi:hypothetical protein
MSRHKVTLVFEDEEQAKFFAWAAEKYIGEKLGEKTLTAKYDLCQSIGLSKQVLVSKPRKGKNEKEGKGKTRKGDK